MKVFRLACARGHDFEGWFASSGEFDRQRSRGEVRCPAIYNAIGARVDELPLTPEKVLRALGKI